MIKRSEDMMSISSDNNGTIPSPALMAQKDIRIYGIIHFGLNTYTGLEWGMGNTSPALFNPADFDAGEIVRAAKTGGLQGLILVCKHHDGFCLWPTQTTSYNISASPWKNGKGDMVKEFSEACKSEGLKFGVYISPWDRNAASYGTAEYPKMFREQIREVLTGYGPVFEMWFDGANGGNGYYGGANETRKIDASTYYDWNKTWALVRKLQPGATIFSDVGPDRRWGGTETGYIEKDCFALIIPQPDPDSGNPIPCPGNADSLGLMTGNPNGKFYRMPECDFPLRRRWFYHSEDDGQTKTATKLLDIYLHSVGCGGTMNIGISPDQQGKITVEDADALRCFKEKVDQLLGQILYETKFTGSKEIALDEKKTFNFIRLAEPFEAGNKINNWRLEILKDEVWTILASGKAVGCCRLRHFQSVSTSKLRFQGESIDGGDAEIAIQLFNVPESLFQETPMEALPSSWENIHGIPLNGNQLMFHLKECRNVSALLFVPRSDASSGTPDRYSLEVSLDGKHWKSVISEGEFGNIKANPVAQEISLPHPESACFIRFTVLHYLDENASALDYEAWGLQTLKIDYHDYQLPATSRKKENIEWSITYAFNATDTVSPRAVFIGDSICNGYKDFVREKLGCHVNSSFWASSKCVTDPDYLRELNFFLDHGTPSIILFNNGLHSLNSIREEWETAYKNVVRFILAKHPESKLVLLLNTPLQDPEKTRISRELNEYSHRLAQEIGLPVADLFTLMDKLDRKTYWSDCFHFTENAKEIQSRFLAEFIMKTLDLPHISGNLVQSATDTGPDGKLK